MYLEINTWPPDKQNYKISRERKRERYICRIYKYALCMYLDINTWPDKQNYSTHIPAYLVYIIQAKYTETHGQTNNTTVHTYLHTLYIIQA